METKYLERGDFSNCATGIIIGFLFSLLALWIYSWAFINITNSPYTVTIALSLLCLSMILSNCFFSKFPYTGVGVAISGSLGQTAAFSIFFWPLPLQGILLMWLLLGIVSYYSGLMRIGRLKRRGYVEKPKGAAQSN